MNKTDINLAELNLKFIAELDMYMKLEEKLKHNAVIKNKCGTVKRSYTNAIGKL